LKRHNRSPKPPLPRLILLAGIIFLGMNAGNALAGERTAFRVCADPHSLPSSDEKQEGYENKIAALFAKDLGLPLEFTWFPQRIGFIRHTLRNNETEDGEYKCDIVMGVVKNFELAATTKPYYRSSWSMVYIKGRGLDAVKTPEDLVNLPDEVKKTLQLGVFDKSPVAQWVLAHGLVRYMVPYQIMTGDYYGYPGEIIEKDLVRGKINVAFAWGPIAGYFAKRNPEQEMVVLPMPSAPGIKFDYTIAMAVRFGDKAWKKQINDLIDRHRQDIKGILMQYHVPLLELKN